MSIRALPNYKKNERAFTLLEMLVAVSLMVLIASFFFRSLLDYGHQQSFRKDLSEIKSLIETTRLKTISAETDSQFGVHFLDNALVIYEGAIYSSSSPTNNVINFSNIDFSTDLTNSDNGFVFSRLYGVPSATGTVQLIYKRDQSTTTVTINSNGLLE